MAVKTSGAPRDPRKKTASAGDATLQRVFLIVALIFLLVIVGGSYLQVRDINGQIRKTEAESVGSTYLTPMAQFAGAMFVHRKLAEEARTHGASPDAVNEVQNGIKTTLSKLEDMNAHQSRVNLDDAWKTVSDRANAIYKTTATGTIPSGDAYDAVNAAIVQFLVDLRDRSNMATDDEIETAYLISVQLDDLPVIVQSLLTGASADQLNQSAGKLVRNMGHVFDLDEDLKTAFSDDFGKLLAGLSAVISIEQANVSDNGDAVTIARTQARDLAIGFATQTSAALTQLLDKRVSKLKARRAFVMGFGFFLAMISMVALWMAAGVAIRASREREAQAEKIRLQDQANQQAILQLLNEMADVAGGNLRIKAQVTESVTGALADSINFTIDELRKLVSQVNIAAEQVAQNVEQTRGISIDLYATSQQQREGLNAAGGQMMQLTELIGEAAKTAEESATVAQKSLAAAEKGSLAVGDSIMSMNEIRERIQETAKQIKRLGESSQEIGEIVELISDITEQTNVLALNASIQAVSAGEAGRGFAIVAEEIQRLAERSAEATKQIGNLVRRIQGDTQEAIATMEKSTQGVVEGTKLSDIAGVSLNEIRDVSGDIADLVRKIADVARKQNALSEQMAKDMPQVLGATEKVAEGTQKTNEAVEYLAKLAGDLKKSVSGFQV